jgi:mutator protein MutT
MPSEIQYQFCPVCGAKYPEASVSGFAHHCAVCGHMFYENLQTTASAIIFQNNQLLLVKRAKNPRLGCWDFPGGFVEPNEHPLQAVQREIQEELGVECTVGELFGFYGPTEYFYQGKRHSNGDVYYLAHLKSLNIQVADDVADFAWFALDNLPSDDQIAFPAQLELIADIKKKFLA